MISISRFDGPLSMNEIDRLRWENAQLHQRMKEFEGRATIRATLVSLEDGVAVFAGGGGVFEQKVGAWAKDAKPGMEARLEKDTLRPLNFTDAALMGCPVVVALRVFDGYVEVQAGPGTVCARIGHQPVKPGDRIVLSKQGEIVIRNLGPGGTARVHVSATNVTWDDIGGLDHAKRELREAIEEPVKHAAIYKRFGKNRCKGIALSGPPGVGKTMLAKAAATTLADLHGASANKSGLITTKGPELLSKFVGDSESNVRALFQSARAHFETHGYPAIMLIEEADGILGKRGLTKWEGMERTIVPQFLAEMDGLDDTGALVLLCTNRIDALDDAFLRDGRIDKKIDIQRPDVEDCAAILAKHLEGRPLKGEAKTLAALTAEAFWHPNTALYMIRTKSGKDRRVTLGDLSSGALCFGIVEAATQLAIRRAVAGEDDGAITGKDLLEGVKLKCEEQRHLMHEADISRIVEAELRADDVKSVDRLKGKNTK